MKKLNAKITKLLVQGVKLSKAEQTAKAAYEAAQEKRKDTMTKLAEEGAIKGMEQVTPKVTRRVLEQVNVNVGYGKVVEVLKAENPQLAARIDELCKEHRTRTTSLKVKEYVND